MAFSSFFAPPRAKPRKPRFLTTVRHFLLFFEAPGLPESSLQGLPNRSKIELRVAWGCLGPLGALLGRSWDALGGLSGRFWGALGGSWAPGWRPRGPQEAPGRHSRGNMEPQRLSNEPQEVSGVRESPGKQLGAPRRNGKRPASARSARARAPRENSLQHRGVFGEPRTTASTHLTHHRRDRKAACTIAKPPQGPERSLHHRQATAGTGKQLAPPPSHRQASDNSSTNVCKHSFF